jgi:hypothetical protein
MTIEKKLGKITNVRFGDGGYDDAMFGLSLTFEMKDDIGTSGVGTFVGGWRTYPKVGARYSEEEWQKSHQNTMLELIRIMTEAKVRDVHDLKGIPVEVTIEGNALKDWRILTEVL